MQEPILRKLFLGFIHIHILSHSKKKPIYGMWMIDELKRHGYDISPGTIYPIFHSLEKNGLIVSENVNVNGKIRKYYNITKKGIDILEETKEKVKELTKEL